MSGKEKWNEISDGLPDFNGRVLVKILERGEIKEKSCWFEIGNRRFEKGFSLLSPFLIEKIIEWKKDD